MKIEILESVETSIGLLCLRRRELLSQPGTIVTEVTLDHEFLMSSYHTASEDALARLGVEWHGGRELSILVGGLGLGYTAQAALDSSAAGSVHVIEFLPEVISWLKRDLVPLAGKLRGEPRFSVERGDFFQTLRDSATRRYDVILVDIDHSPDENLDSENLPFYSVGGLRQARTHLREKGVLAVWSSAPNDGFVSALAEAFAEVKVEKIEWFNDLVDEEQTDYVFLAKG
jgi:spermidine synthase